MVLQSTASSELSTTKFSEIAEVQTLAFGGLVKGLGFRVSGFGFGV